MSADNSYRTILRSSSIIGGAQVVKILIGLVKIKFVAVVLGPAGVGLVGLYMSLIHTASTLVGLGISSSGTRRIASTLAEQGAEGVLQTRRALFWGTLVLCILGALIFWLSSGWIAQIVLDDPDKAHDIAWLALGVALSVASGAQVALLTGLRQIGDLARIKIASGLIGTAVSMLLLWLWQRDAIVALVIVAPACSFLLGHYYVSRLKPGSKAHTNFNLVIVEWGQLVRLGFPIMLSALILALGHLIVRGHLQRELGAVALGQFQAAWTIGVTYLGFVFGSMGTDYYPRLSSAISDAEKSNKLVNEQTEVAILLCAPPILMILGLSPWIIEALYSSEFVLAVDVLRWQLIGDVLKILSWPLGFVMLARGDGRSFFLIETVSICVFVFGVIMGTGYFGVVATGMSFLSMYLVYLPLVFLYSKLNLNFRWSRSVFRQAVLVLSAAIVTDLVSRNSSLLGAGLGVMFATIFGFWALMALSHKANARGFLGRVGAFGVRLKKWISKIV